MSPNERSLILILHAMKQQKIIVSVDFSQASLAAVEVGAQFAKWHGSELILLHVLEPISQIAQFLQGQDLKEKARKFAAGKLQAIEKQYDAIKISHMYAEGKPYKEILAAADHIEAELIVMGTLGEDAEENEYLVGSNVNKVLRSAECPVVTVKESPRDLNMKDILVPVDPVFGIRELRSYLKQYKDNYSPTIHLVCVTTEDSEQKEEVVAYLDKQKAALHKLGMETVETYLLEGDIVSKEVVNFAVEAEMDMIWMETHGRKGIGNLLLGSKTEEVLVRSPIPVFCLRPDRAPAARGYYAPNSPV